MNTSGILQSKGFRLQVNFARDPKSSGLLQSKVEPEVLHVNFARDPKYS